MHIAETVTNHWEKYAHEVLSSVHVLDNSICVTCEGFNILKITQEKDKWRVVHCIKHYFPGLKINHLYDVQTITDSFEHLKNNS